MQNNFTLELKYTTYETLQPMMPILKFLELVGTNVSYIPPHCWQTTFEFVEYMQTLFIGADYDFNKFLISYLFT